MSGKIVLHLLVCLALSFQAPVARAQDTPRPGGVPGGTPSIPGQGTEGSPAGLGLAFATEVNGESFLKSADEEEWVVLSPRLSLRVGDRIWVQNGSRIEIRFPLGATAWVSYQSELDITRLERGSRVDTIQLALVSGEASFDVKAFSRPGSVFQVDIPNASIRASRAARFRVNTLPDGTAQIGVSSGSLVLETPDGLAEVGGGRMAELQPEGRIVLDFLPASDEWDSWVRSRSGFYDRPAASQRYLPADLSPYAYEFDTSGRWVREPSYGFVWVPAVERGWSPYSNGRWVWQGDDYVWLSYDPWYAPFHFGRWNWGISLGWFWIAPRGRAYWSPGYVSWAVGGDEVSWVPLGHGEMYYGYGNYGPDSVNVLKRAVINVARAAANSRVANGVVAVRKEDFLRGRIRERRLAPSRNPFEGGGEGKVKVIGRPPVHEIKPIRETRQPRPEVEIKRISLPPVRLEKESVTIKERVVAPTRDASVFKPGTPPAQLKNILKEKELEQWVPPRRAPAPRAVVVPAPEGRVNMGDPAGKPAPQVIRVREAPPPAGKHLFKRLPEPPGKGAVAPARTLVPEERLKDLKEKSSAEELRKAWGERGAAAGE